MLCSFPQHGAATRADAKDVYQVHSRRPCPQKLLAVYDSTMLVPLPFVIWSSAYVTYEYMSSCSNISQVRATWCCISMIGFKDWQSLQTVAACQGPTNAGPPCKSQQCQGSSFGRSASSQVLTLLWSQLSSMLISPLSRAHLCILVVIPPPGDLDAESCGHLPDSLQIRVSM